MVRRRTTLQVLDRVEAHDPACKDVSMLEAMVNALHAFGARDLPHTLGHPKILQRVMQYLHNFMCSVCDPVGFGVARAHAAVVLAHGWLRFMEAAELLQLAMGFVRKVDVIAARELEMTQSYVSMRMESSWFAKWKKD